MTSAPWDAEPLREAAASWLPAEPPGLARGLADPAAEPAATALLAGRLLRCSAMLRHTHPILMGWAEVVRHHELDAIGEALRDDIRLARQGLLGWAAHDPCLARLLAKAAVRPEPHGDASTTSDSSWALAAARARDDAASRLAALNLAALAQPDDPYPWQLERTFTGDLTEVDAIAAALAPALGDVRPTGDAGVWIREEGAALGEGWWLDLLRPDEPQQATLRAALANEPSSRRKRPHVTTTHRVAIPVRGWDGLLAADDASVPEDPLCDEEPVPCDELPTGWELRVGPIPLPHGGALLGVRLSLLPGTVGDLREADVLYVRDVHGERLEPFAPRYQARHKHVWWGGYAARSCVVEAGGASIWVDEEASSEAEGPAHTTDSGGPSRSHG